LVGPLIFHFVKLVHRVCFYYELYHCKSILQEYNPWNFVSRHTEQRTCRWCGKAQLSRYFLVLPFWKGISKVVNISSNQKTSEVTYTSYYARQIFTKIHRAMQLDNDDRFLGGRALKEVHKYLQLPTDVRRMMDQDLTVCEQWHEECVVVVPS